MATARSIAVDKNANPLLITFNQTGTNDLTFIEVPVEFGWKWHDVPFSDLRRFRL